MHMYRGSHLKINLMLVRSLTTVQCDIFSRLVSRRSRYLTKNKMSTQKSQGARA